MSWTALILLATVQEPPPYIQYVDRFERKAEWAVTMMLCSEAKVGDIRLTKNEINTELSDLVRLAIMDRIPASFADREMGDAIKRQAARVDHIGFDDLSVSYWKERLSACFSSNVNDGSNENLPSDDRLGESLVGNVSDLSTRSVDVEEQQTVYPARIWVQVATGGSARALRDEFQLYRKRLSQEFEGRNGATAQWGRTYRLLIGPFDSRKSANAWLAGLKKVGGDGFVWISNTGEPVLPVE